MMTDISPPITASFVQAKISRACSSANDHLLRQSGESSSAEIFFNICVCVREEKSSFVDWPDRIRTVDPRARRLAVKRCLEAWMRPSAGMERGGGALVPYGGPIVEMDALIGVKCIRCLDFCQNQHPSSDSWSLLILTSTMVMIQKKQHIW